MIERALHPTSLQIDKASVLWALTLAFSAKLVTLTGSTAAMLGWQAVILLILPLLLPLRFVVTSVLAAIVFLDASIWFQQGIFTANTIYESRGAWIKPPEILLLVLALRLMIVHNLDAALSLPIKMMALGFAAFTVLGAATARLYGTQLSDILTFSELRSPLVMVAALLLLAPLARLNPRFFIDTLGILVLVHFAISLLSWGGGMSLLWASFASHYAGNTDAFFGADESVMVYLLVQAIALGVVLSQKPDHLSSFGKRFWWLMLAVTAFAITASLRRGGVMCSAILIVYVFTCSGLIDKLRMTILLLVTLPIVLFAALQLGMLDALQARLGGEGSVAQSDFGRDTDALQARDHIARYFWFGTGAATRLALLRTQAYGVAESLSIHQSVYHIWVRLGIFGAGAYILLFLQPCLRALGSLWRSAGSAQPSPTLPVVLCLSGLILALFLWGLHIPAIFINFRQAGVWVLAAVLIYALTPDRAPRPRTDPILRAGMQRA